MGFGFASRQQLAHGVGCGMALPSCIAYNQRMPAQAGADLAAAVLGRPGASLRDIAEAAQSLTRAVGIYTDLGTLGTTAEEIPSLAESVARDYPRPTNPVPLEPGRLGQLLTYLRSGDLPPAWAPLGEPPSSTSFG